MPKFGKCKIKKRPGNGAFFEKRIIGLSLKRTDVFLRGFPHMPQSSLRDPSALPPPVVWHSDRVIPF